MDLSDVSREEGRHAPPRGSPSRALVVRSARLVLIVQLMIGFDFWQSAGAMIIGTSEQTDARPLDDPGWDYVAARANASAVYLGDRWVLTAFHVGAGSVKLLGRTFAKEPGEGIQLENPPGLGLSPFTDLRMFRLQDDPGLPPLRISQSLPPILSPVTMVGYGRTRAGGLAAWNVDAEGNWVEAPPGEEGRYSGFKLGTPQKRWGTNWIDRSATLNGSHGDALSYRAGFYPQQSPYEARAAGGDSGGGVFFKNGNQWELLGIIQSVTTQQGQPGDIAVYGDATNFANLAFYRNQIQQHMLLANQLRPWQNPKNALNVNNDRVVSPIDALAIINELNHPAYSDRVTRALPGLPPGAQTPRFYFDVNGDGFVSPNDALRVINELNLENRVVNASGVRSSGVVALSVPEPTTAGLAATAVVLLWISTKVRR